LFSDRHGLLVSRGVRDKDDVKHKMDRDYVPRDRDDMKKDRD
jgi:hypothetical protein